jgi:hypothetical protein
MIIVANGMLIEWRYLPYALQETPGTALALTNAWEQVKVRARLNLVLMLVVVALGEAMRYSKF